MTDQNKAGFRREAIHLFCSEMNVGWSWRHRAHSVTWSTVLVQGD